MFQCLNKLIKQKHCLLIHLFKMCLLLWTHLNVSLHLQGSCKLVAKVDKMQCDTKRAPPSLNWLLLFPSFSGFFPFKRYLF